MASVKFADSPRISASVMLRPHNKEAPSLRTAGQNTLMSPPMYGLSAPNNSVSPWNHMIWIQRASHRACKRRSRVAARGVGRSSLARFIGLEFLPLRGPIRSKTWSILIDALKEGWTEGKNIALSRGSLLLRACG